MRRKMPNAPTLYLDRTLTQHRALSMAGRRAVLGLFIAGNLVVAAFLIVIHAFPVPFFLGLDLIGVLVAFHVSERRSQRTERVTVSADSITVSRVQPGAESRTVWIAPPAFTRIEEGARALRLRRAGRSLAFATTLGAQDRTRLAAEIASALRAAQNERW